MTRSDLIERIGGPDAEMCVLLILRAMANALREGRRVEIRDFGCFTTAYRSARTMRNPNTGAAVHVPGKSVPHFKAGRELKRRVREQQERARRTAHRDRQSS